ncbi:bifunctional adenosylcobinamide kinase/adenosylcobinamide-phosphate guanylyltransferase [Paenibacillus solisilvae]|uniref:Adenosylcobinamide kinase n=1 Tax=Paenibacillus solisilvae TaxID=2486751 RepID=A0ABW0VSG5_9BACL
MAIIITGGARSGKSDFAERYAMHLCSRGIYIATSQSWDEEMAERIKRHKQVRESAAFAWETIEEPYEIAAMLRKLEKEALNGEDRPAVLIDCLTLWLTNWMLKLDADHEHPSPDKTSGTGEDTPQNRVDESLPPVIEDFVQAVTEYSGTLLMVTNEVGSGIVPAYPLGRRFRDEAGRLNRRLAAVCEQAFLVVAGFPLDLKAHAFQLGEL